jgi:3-methylfumaryl-CoA hydratase
VVERFRFRALRPTFDVSPFEVLGEPDAEGGGARVRLWSTDNAGATAVEAEAWLR